MNYQGEIVKLLEYIPDENGSDEVNLIMPDGSLITMDANERNSDVIGNALGYFDDLLAIED